MTIDQLHTAFKIEIDKVSMNSSFGSYPAFLPEEIDYWLDKAMYQVISNKFTGNNVLKVPFEKSVKRIHDLEKLIVTEHKEICQSMHDVNAVVLKDAFKDKLFYVEGILTFDLNKANITLIEHADAKRFIQTYNNIPWIDEPVAVIENDDLIIYYDPVSMNAKTYKVDLTVVKQPTKLSETSVDIDEFPENVLYEIISRSVALALESIESNRSQTKTQLIQIDE